jgi:hypothetical protein
MRGGILRRSSRSEQSHFYFIARFSLSDDQARDLVQRVSPLLDRYPVDPRDHRPFLRAFLRAVHDVTGKLYGPDIYRRLLRAYAPGRNPSTPTIASERDALERELAAAGTAAGSSPAALVRAPLVAPAPDVFALRALFDEYLPHVGRVAAQAARDAQVNYLQGRLRETDRSAADAKAHAARLAGELQAQTARADLLAGELAARDTALAAQQAVVGSLTEELKGQRLFAMQSIEMGRAETRLAKEHVAELQARIERLEVTIDQLRMTRGAPGGMR